jgi:3-dehydroquinate synthase
MAEVIKHAVIRDAGYFAWLEANIGALLRCDADALTHAIHRSCEIKAAVVAADERETGERALLNFGHTFGHAIETDQGYGTWLHGEAVAAGMVCAARLSQRLCGLAASQTQRLADLLAAARLPIKPPTLAGERWLDLMRRDKKVDAGAIRVIALETIGRAVLRSDATDDDIVASTAG